MTRLLALILAYFFLGLAILGVFLPGLPTVPFLLLTAWFAARGSERLHAWLYAHPHFGKLLIDWEREGAISRRTKVITILMLLASLAIMYYRTHSLWLLAGLAALFSMTGTYVLTRPEPKGNRQSNEIQQEAEEG